MRRLLATTVALVVALTALGVVSAQAPTPPPRANPVIKLLEQGKPAFSIWANYIGVGKDYHAAVTLQNNKNYDFILYDLEHDPLDVEGLASSCGRCWIPRRLRRRASASSSRSSCASRPTAARFTRTSGWSSRSSTPEVGGLHHRYERRGARRGSRP